MPGENMIAPPIPDQNASQSNLPIWLFIFGLCFAVWNIVPAFSEIEVWNKCTLGDVMDLTTPYVIFLLASKLYLIMKKQTTGTQDRGKWRYAIPLMLLVGGITSVEGHGIHLSSNAIFRYLTRDQDTPMAHLTYFFDEVHGHIFWDAGLLLIAFALIITGMQSIQRSSNRWSMGWISGGALLYGFTHFANGVEGQTAVFTFPAAVLIPGVLISTFSGIRDWRTRHPIVSFYLIAFIFADILFVIWGLINDGFPEFSELGWI
jgi:hypothetical protein